MKKIGDFLLETGLSFDKESQLIYGQYKGYQVAIQQNGNANQFIMSFSLGLHGQAVTKEDLLGLKEGAQSVANAQVVGHHVKVTSKSGLTFKKGIAKLRQALEESVTFFEDKQFTNRCQLTNEVETALYLVGSTPVFLSESGLEKQQFVNANEQIMEESANENVFLGLIGAFIGSLVGVLVSVIIGQLGYVSFVSGIVMGVATLKGYELLGKRLSIKGIVISIFLTIIMTYFAYQLDWALYLVRYTGGEANVFDAMAIIPELLMDGSLDTTDYWIELGKLYLFNFGGAAVTIISYFKEHKGRHAIRRLS